jgi:hypothetical protein
VSNDCLEDAEPTKEMEVDIYEGDKEFEINTPKMRDKSPDFFIFHCYESTWGKNPKDI